MERRRNDEGSTIKYRRGRDDPGSLGFAVVRHARLRAQINLWWAERGSQLAWRAGSSVHLIDAPHVQVIHTRSPSIPVSNSPQRWCSRWQAYRVPISEGQGSDSSADRITRARPVGNGAGRIQPPRALDPFSILG